MARLGKQDISSAATRYVVYTVPSATQAVVNVIVCNRNSSVVKIRIAMEDSGSSAMADEDYIEYDADIPGNSVLERTAISMAVGEIISVQSDTTGVTCVVQGIAESTS